MAISFSRPDPSSPAAVADASFPTSRRGFDQNEVRDFLRMVAAELARLQERERYLDYEMRALRQQRANLPTELDDEAIAKLLGEETARIVHAARDASNADPHQGRGGRRAGDPGGRRRRPSSSATPPRPRRRNG